jgi:hypothetical protein
VLIRFAYLAATHTFAALRPLPMTDREKDVEILAPRHQLTILQRQLGNQRQSILAAIHHASRRVRILGTTAHPTHTWVAQAIRNLLIDLDDTGNLTRIRFLIQDRDAKYPTLIDEILTSADITTMLAGVRMPRMNSIVERWIKTSSNAGSRHCAPNYWTAPRSGTRPTSDMRYTSTSTHNVDRGAITVTGGSISAAVGQEPRRWCGCGVVVVRSGQVGR